MVIVRGTQIARFRYQRRYKCFLKIEKSDRCQLKPKGNAPVIKPVNGAINTVMECNDPYHRCMRSEAG